MDDMKDIFAANAARADEEERQRQEAADAAAAAEAAAEAEVMKRWAAFQRTRRRKATRAFLLRVAAAAGLVAALRTAMGFDLIAPALAVPLEACALAWATGWAGAWLQYIGKGPLK